MSGSPTLASENLELQNVEGGRKPKHYQCVKKMQAPINLFLGEKTKLNKVLETVDLALVGRFRGRKRNTKTLKVWMKTSFEPIVGYTPRALILVRDLKVRSFGMWNIQASGVL
jgi:hypothetical protein